LGEEEDFPSSLNTEEEPTSWFQERVKETSHCSLVTLKELMLLLYVVFCLPDALDQLETDQTPEF
jgi:hypothetical protein